MKTNLPIFATAFFICYLYTVLLTDYSLTGFWTDIVFSVLFTTFLVAIVFRTQFALGWLKWTIRVASILCTLVVFGLLALNLLNPFVVDTFKLRSFYFKSVDGRMFNAYFKPVGSYSGGYGNFWISETPRFFPIVEKRVYWDRTVDHDFGSDEFEGNPIDNDQVVRAYIKDEIIDKGN